MGSLVLALTVDEHAVHVVAHKLCLVRLRESLTCKCIVKLLFNAFELAPELLLALGLGDDDASRQVVEHVSELVALGLHLLELSNVLHIYRTLLVQNEERLQGDHHEEHGALSLDRDLEMNDAIQVQAHQECYYADAVDDRVTVADAEH